MQSVNEYISLLDGAKKEWTILMVNFMREVFPEVEETFVKQMPTYKGESYFIAFAAHKSYFSFYTDDIRVLSLVKELVPSASVGKGCVRVKYGNQFAIEALMDACKEIVDYNKSKQSPAVSDMKALQKWAKVPADIQQLLINNVFCSKCGVTTIVNYGIHNDRYGVVLKGSCNKCGLPVARMMEE